MRVSFDIDGVLADFAAVAVAEIRKLYCPDLPKDYTQPTWNFDEILLPDQWSNVFVHLMNRDCFWQDLPCFQDNVNALAEYADNYGSENIFMITSRSPCAGGSTETMTKLWLWEHDLPMENVFVVQRATEKAQIIKDNQIAYSIDDYWPTVEQCSAIAGHNARLLDHAYNETVTHLPRVYSVAEFLAEVELGS